jgi:hypothetical protein
MMTLLERIAQSNGNPQRTIAALRLINKRLRLNLVKSSPYFLSLETRSEHLGWFQGKSYLDPVSETGRLPG